MKRLYLLRHAKSSWNQPHLTDFDRPLNPRGYKDAQAMADYIEEQGYQPEVILCSSAKRTRETLRPILALLETQPEVIYLDSIYEADWTALRDAVECRNEDSVMLIGHCPGIEMYLSRILGQITEMKTCHLAVIDWQDKELIDFIRPKEFK